MSFIMKRASLTGMFSPGSKRGGGDMLGGGGDPVPNPELESQLNKRKSEIVEERVKKTVEHHRSLSKKKELEEEVENLRLRLRRASSLGIEVVEDARTVHALQQRSRMIRSNRNIFEENTSESCPRFFFNPFHDNPHNNPDVTLIANASEEFFLAYRRDNAAGAAQFNDIPSTSRRAAMQAVGNTEISKLYDAVRGIKDFQALDFHDTSGITVVNADKPSVTLTFAGLPPNPETAVAFIQWTMVEDLEKDGACDEGRMFGFLKATLDAQRVREQVYGAISNFKQVRIYEAKRKSLTFAPRSSGNLLEMLRREEEEEKRKKRQSASLKEARYNGNKTSTYEGEDEDEYAMLGEEFSFIAYKTTTNIKNLVRLLLSDCDTLGMEIPLPVRHSQDFDLHETNLAPIALFESSGLFGLLNNNLVLVKAFRRGRVKEMQQEERALRLLANTNVFVPKLVSFSEFNSLVFLKFDYERIEPGRAYPVSDFADVVRCLRDAHSKNLFHRNINLENVVIGKETTEGPKSGTLLINWEFSGEMIKKDVWVGGASSLLIGTVFGSDEILKRMLSLSEEEAEGSNKSSGSNSKQTEEKTEDRGEGKKTKNSTKFVDFKAEDDLQSLAKLIIYLSDLVNHRHSAFRRLPSRNNLDGIITYWRNVLPFISPVNRAILAAAATASYDLMLDLMTEGGDVIARSLGLRG